jgi:hypothetical protein
MASSTARQTLNPTSSLSSVIPDDEIADLLSSEEVSSGYTESPWKSEANDRDSILFPNGLLEATRSENMSARAADRLSHLWNISNSHGVSWDELDDKFLTFHREYLKAEQEWYDTLDQRWDEEYKKSEEQLRSTLQGDEAQITLILNRRRGKIRRMTYTRLARMRNKQILKQFSLPQFIDHMKRFVTYRVAKREQSERNL